MKPFLLDINLLIALAWPSHIHHEIAHRWFAKKSHFGWATCPITQCGFVRISSNTAIIKDAVSVAESMNVLKKMTSLKHHIFWKDEIEIVNQSYMPTELLISHRQVTDAYLLGLAVFKKAKLATLDQKIQSLLPLNSRYHSFLEIVAI